MDPLILFAQQANDAERIGRAVGQGISGIIYFAMLVFYIFYLISMQKALNLTSPENRDMEPGMVFLGLIPCFHFVWYFLIVSRVASSLEKEFADRRVRGDGDFGRSVGITGGVLMVLGCLCSCIGIGWLICAIIHMNKINAYSKTLEERDSRRSVRYDDDDDDDRPRRRRHKLDDDEDDDDDRPRKKKRRRDEDDDD